MQHVLIENKRINGRNQNSCFLCSMVYNDGKRRTSKYGYIVCEKGFHVNCFAAYHYRHTLGGRAGTIRTLIETVERTNIEDKNPMQTKKCQDQFSQYFKPSLIVNLLLLNQLLVFSFGYRFLISFMTQHETSIRVPLPK